MEQRRGISWGAIAFVIAVLMAVTMPLLPRTAWITYSQWRILTGYRWPSSLKTEHPPALDDYTEQVATALSNRPGEDNIKDSSPLVMRLRQLLARFGDRPALYAHILRSMAVNQVRLTRPEIEELRPKPARSANSGFDTTPPKIDEQVSAPADLALFEEIAVRGAALDPNNAYFPLLHAAVAYATNRDSEAVHWLAQAARSSHYDDYAMDEARCRTAALVSRNGEISMVTRTVIDESLYCPEYNLIRTAARATVVRAVHLESAGHIDDGLHLRQTLVRIGAMMRGSSCGTQLGISLTSLATLRPSGVPALSDHETGNTAERSRREADRYIVYLKHIGYPEEAQWFVAERAAGQEIIAIQQAIFAKDLLLGPILRLPGFYYFSLVLLLGVFWTLVLGMLATWFIWRQPVGEMVGLSAEVRDGLIMAILGPALVGIGLWLDSANNAVGNLDNRLYFWFTYSPIILLITLIPAVRLRKRRETWRHCIPPLLRMFGVVVGLYSLLGLVVGSLSWLDRMFVEASADLFGENSVGYYWGLPLSITAAIIAALLTLPLLINIGSVIRSLVRKTPVSLGIAWVSVELPCQLLRHFWLPTRFSTSNSRTRRRAYASNTRLC